MRPTESDVVRLTRRAGESVEVNIVVAIGDERRRSIVIRSIGYKTKHGNFRFWIRRFRLPDVPLTNSPIFGAGQEVEWRGLGDDPLDGSTVRSEDLGISRTGRKNLARASYWSYSFNVKDSDFGVAGTRHDLAVIRVWHEFH